MPMNAADIEHLIKRALPDAEISITDLAGDAITTRPMSSRRNSPARRAWRVAQHKLVFDALGGRMGGELHALALTTAAPK